METAIVGSDWFSPAEAGHRLGVTSQWARRLAERGAVRSVRTSLGTLLLREDVERLAREREQHDEGAPAGKS